jgi:hypothetical protein
VVVANVNLNLRLFNTPIEPEYRSRYTDYAAGLSRDESCFDSGQGARDFFFFPKSRDRVRNPRRLLFNAQWGWRSTRGQRRKLYLSLPYTAALDHGWN